MEGYSTTCILVYQRQQQEEIRLSELYAIRDFLKYISHREAKAAAGNSEARHTAMIIESLSLSKPNKSGAQTGGAKEDVVKSVEGVINKCIETHMLPKREDVILAIVSGLPYFYSSGDI